MSDDYQLPTPGTILLALSNRNLDGTERVPNPGPTRDPVLFKEWLQAATQGQAFDQNVIRAIDYTNYFWNSWFVQYDSGRMFGPTGIQGDPDAPPPMPKAAVVVVVTRELGFDIQPSGQAVVNNEYVFQFATGPYIPVCGVPAYKKISPPQH